MMAPARSICLMPLVSVALGVLAPASAQQVPAAPTNANDISDQPGTATDLIPVVSECLKNRELSKAIPAADQWRVKSYALGSPRSAEALRTKNMRGMMDAMTQRSTIFVKDGQRGYLNLRSSRTVFVACQAYMNIASMDQFDAVKSLIVANLALRKADKIDVKFDLAFFMDQNLLGDVADYYETDTAYVLFHREYVKENNVFSAYILQK